MTDLMNSEAVGERLRAIGKKFGLQGKPVSVTEIRNGNINRSWRVDYKDERGGESSWLFQCVNTFAFRQPAELMSNIEKVTAHMKERFPDRPVLSFLYADSGSERKNYLIEDGEFWRVCNFIPSVTYNTCDDPEVIRNAGRAFGDFQRALSDFDPSPLFETIPGFHDTRKRYRDLLQAADQDASGRKAEIGEELAWLLSVEDRSCLITDLQNSGKLPLRVTHNDTKINNVLFDRETREALTVIDLDTVMPGAAGSDFGDAIRFAANFTEEDSTDLEHAGLNMEVFRAFADGFLEATGNALTETEIETLPDACFSLTAELAARFLEDYLRGDIYFKLRDKRHNLDRTRNQIALAKDMLNKMDEMRAAVVECAEKYRGR